MKKIHEDDVKCALCRGSGLDTTGLMVNGKPKPICVRCGGYGSIPKSCENPTELLEKEKEQIAKERESLLEQPV